MGKCETRQRADEQFMRREYGRAVYAAIRVTLIGMPNTYTYPSCFAFSRGDYLHDPSNRSRIRNLIEMRMRHVGMTPVRDEAAALGFDDKVIGMDALTQSSLARIYMPPVGPRPSLRHSTNAFAARDGAPPDDRDMAAYAHNGPVMVQEAVPAPVVDLTAEPAVQSAYDGKPKTNGASVEHDADDGDAWETASLLEEILDEVDAFEYSDGAF